jgi:O-methyltransferase involved in polyketide biosynthesis
MAIEPTRSVSLGGIPETTLWTLHNRQAEARRPDGLLRDPDCVRIYDSIAYDFERNFGKPDSSHPMRSRICDAALRPWLARHRGGTVVELGAGLETQFQRCDDGAVQWLCVDVPEAIEVRSRFLPPAPPRYRYIARSALDVAWLDEVDPSRGVFVTAQGLFMYFHEEDVRRLVVAMAERFPELDLIFDTIPPWFAKRTMRGYGKTKHYTAPKMPWGIRRGAIEPTLRRWVPRFARIQTQSYGLADRGASGIVLRMFDKTPGLREVPPAIAHVSTSAAG